MERINLKSTIEKYPSEQELKDYDNYLYRDGQKQEDLKRLGTKETAKRIRQDIKNLNIKGLKVSVVCDFYSMGSSINLAVMESPVELIKNPEEIKKELSKYETLSYDQQNLINRSESDYKKGHYDVNQYHINDSDLLTDYGKQLLTEINNIFLKYHRDNSNSMIDYFDVNFYYDLSVGKWDKPYKVVV